MATNHWCIYMGHSQTNTQQWRNMGASYVSEAWSKWWDDISGVDHNAKWYDEFSFGAIQIHCWLWQTELRSGRYVTGWTIYDKNMIKDLKSNSLSLFCFLSLIEYCLILLFSAIFLFLCFHIYCLWSFYTVVIVCPAMISFAWVLFTWPSLFVEVLHPSFFVSLLCLFHHPSISHCLILFALMLFWTSSRL